MSHFHRCFHRFHPFHRFHLSPFHRFSHLFTPFHFPGLARADPTDTNRCILKFIIWPYSFSPCHIFTVFTFHPFHRFQLSPFHRFHLSPLFILPGWPGLTRQTNRCILKFIIWPYSFSPCHIFTVFTFHLFSFVFTLFTFSPFSPFTPFHFAGLARADPTNELLYTKIYNLALLVFTLSHFHRFHLSPFHPFQFSFSPFHLFTVFTFHPFSFCRAGPG